jgi:hypothetical protein
MTDEKTQANGGVPPKLDPAKAGLVPQEAAPAAAPEPVAPKRQTARIDLAAAQPPPEPAAKKKTSRIALTEAEAGTAPRGVTPPLTVAPTGKTIRIAPLGGPKPPAAPAPAEAPAAPKTVPVTKPAAAEAPAKSQTSRIPLEAALAPEEAGAQAAAGIPTPPPSTGGVPKTIRIKRPGATAATVKLTRPGAEPEAVPTVAEALTAEAVKSKTAQIDVAAIAPEEPGQATQRKTIKIRRPEGGVRPIPRSVAVARLETEAAERLAEAASWPGLTFTILAAVAAVVVCVLLYVLLAQSAPGLGLKLPGILSL